MVIFRVTSRRRASRDENLPGLSISLLTIAHGSKVTRINFRKEGEGLGSRLLWRAASLVPRPDPQEVTSCGWGPEEVGHTSDYVIK